MAIRRPKTGIVGETALREAFAGDYQQLIEVLRGALKNLWKMAGVEDPWPYVRAVYDDSLVAERDGKLWRYPYTIGESNAVAFGAPVEVVQRYVNVETASGMRESQAFVGVGAFLETLDGQVDGKPARYRIVVVNAGASGNGNYYPDAVLREAVPLFEGVRVFVKGDAEHLAGGGKDFRNLVGRLTEPRFVEGRPSAADTGRVEAVFELIEPEGAVAVKIREAWSRGMTQLFGFSIDATANSRPRQAGGSIPGSGPGTRLREATKFRRVSSVDLIVEPGAGGQIIQLIEAKRDTIMNREQLIQLLEAKGLLKGKKVDELTDDQLTDILREAVAGPADPKAAATPAPGITPEQLADAMRMSEARSYARGTIGASTLPQAAKDRLQTRFKELASFTETQVDQAITDEGAYVARFTESGHVTGLGDFPRVQAGETRSQKVHRMLDAFFDPSHADHRHAQSFKECYVEITGDRRVTGSYRECDQVRLREALDSASFDDVLGDSITRRLVAEYRTADIYTIWRPLVTVVPISDFRSQQRTRYGGYGDLPTVAQGAPYAPLTSPTDEKATYTPAKKGGTEQITLEMISNDDVGVIRGIPMRLARAGKRTVAKFVLDFVRTNPTLYDGVAFFHATHGNLGTAALDATSLAARRLAMKQVTELSSAERIGIGPRHLVVPDDLEETAVNLFNRNTNHDRTFLQTLSLNIIPVWYWTDANDWAIAADPNDVPGIEVGFLNGQEEPELFVQDAPTSGSMFSHDQLTWKIRHIYGGTVTDFRGWQKGVVA